MNEANVLSILSQWQKKHEDTWQGEIPVSFLPLLAFKNLDCCEGFSAAA